MLHISISASLYRPLALHVQIAKKHRNVLQLQEATHESLQDEQQMVLNKESMEYSSQLKKLQAKCPHHDQQQNTYNPDDIVAKLQVS